MSWRNELVWSEVSGLKNKASFRGEKFFINDATTEVGRRNIIHQYPERDDANIEDLGKDIDTFTIQGYVIQNSDNDLNYFGERDALMDALKKKGPGTLIHPFLGEKIVNVVGRVSINENFANGGIARFTMTFVEAKQTVEESPITEADPVSAMDTAIDLAIEDSKDGFGSVYSYGGETSPDSFLDAMVKLDEMLKKTIKTIKNTSASQISEALGLQNDSYSEIVETALTTTCSIANSIIGMFDGFDNIINTWADTDSYIYGPCGSTIRGISSGPFSGAQVDFSEQVTNVDSATRNENIDEDLGTSTINALLELSRYGESTEVSNPSQYGGQVKPISITSASKAQESANNIAAINLARNIALLKAAKFAVRTSYKSYESLKNTLDEIIEAINVQLLKLGDDAANEDYFSYDVEPYDALNYDALELIRPTLIESLEDIGLALPKVVDYEVPPTVESSLTLAYDKYEDLDREKEIIDRNQTTINHPGFLPQGEEIEIFNE